MALAAASAKHAQNGALQQIVDDRQHEEEREKEAVFGEESVVNLNVVARLCLVRVHR